MNYTLVGLIKSASLVVTAMKAKILEVSAPRNIIDAISIEPPIIEGGNASIEIKINVKEAPAARAYEWGSGIHSTRGKVGTIRIPKEGFGLGIPQERWENFDFPVIPGPKMIGLFDNVFALTFVDHPGVAPRPYIAPTIIQTAHQVKEILGQSFKADILVGQAKIEVIQ